MTSEKVDKSLASEIRYAFQDLTGFAARVDLENRIVAALTAARKEEREAVFSEAIETLNSIEYSRDADNGGYFYSGFLAAKKQLIGALEGRR